MTGLPPVQPTESVRVRAGAPSSVPLTLPGRVLDQLVVARSVGPGSPPLVEPAVKSYHEGPTLGNSRVGSGSAPLRARALRVPSGDGAARHPCTPLHSTTGRHWRGRASLPPPAKGATSYVATSSKAAPSGRPRASHQLTEFESRPVPARHAWARASPLVSRQPPSNGVRFHTQLGVVQVLHHERLPPRAT